MGTGEAILLEPGEGEVISEGDERELRIKVGREELVVTESRYSEGESGPGAHIHKRHWDCFYVLEGELVFELAGGERVTAGEGGFAAVPPMLVHTFWNEGPEDARFINIHAPGCGFDEHLRAMRDGEEAGSEQFDTYEPPEDGGRPASDALLRPQGEGEELRMGPSRVLLKASAEEIDSLMLAESTVGAGFPGPVLHHHERMVDSFYVLEGTLTLRLGDREVSAGPGSFAAAPPGAVHTFSNPGEHDVRMLNLIAPAGYEGYLREVAAALAAGTRLGPEELARIAQRYDFVPAG